MAITFDRVNSLIIVEAPETVVTIQELLDAIRDFEDNQSSMDLSHIAEASGKEDLGGGTLVGITLKLIDWKVKFEDRSPPDTVVCEVTGGNIVCLDSETETFINPIAPSAYVTAVKTSSASATISEIEDMRTDLAFIKQIEAGRWKIYENQMIFYDTDGTTPLITFDLKDKSGDAAETNIYERNPV